jgi:hypothetical protein
MISLKKKQKKVEQPPSAVHCKEAGEGACSTRKIVAKVNNIDPKP